MEIGDTEEGVVLGSVQDANLGLDFGLSDNGDAGTGGLFFCGTGEGVDDVCGGSSIVATGLDLDKASFIALAPLELSREERRR